MHCKACMQMFEPIPACRQCMDLFLTSCYCGSLLKEPENVKLTLLRSAIESTEQSLDSERCRSKSLKMRLQEMRAKALAELQADIRLHMGIYEAGIEWMQANAPLVQAEIKEIVEQTGKAKEKSERLKNKIQSVKEPLKALTKKKKGKAKIRPVLTPDAEPIVSSDRSLSTAFYLSSSDEAPLVSMSKFTSLPSFLADLQSHTQIYQCDSQIASVAVRNMKVFAGLMTGRIVAFSGNMRLLEERHLGFVSCIKISTDARLFVSASEDATCKVWDFKSEAVIGLLVGHKSDICCLDIAADGRHCVTGSKDTTVKMWDLERFTLVANFEKHSGLINCVAITPDMKCISGSEDKTVKVWSVSNTDDPGTRIPEDKECSCVAVTPDGLLCVCGYDDGSLLAWELPSVEKISSLLGHSKYISTVSIFPDNVHCASSSFDTLVKIWHIRDGICIQTLQGHTKEVYSVAVARNGEFCVSGSEDASLRIWNIADERRKGAVITGHSQEVMSVVVVAGGGVLSASLDTTIKHWSLEEQRITSEFNKHTDGVQCLATSIDGKQFVSASKDGCIKVWDLKDHREIADLSGLISEVTSVAIMPDGFNYVFGTSDGNLQHWTPAGKSVKTLKRHPKGIHCVAVPPSAEICLFGTDDALVVVWDFAKEQILKSFSGHSRSVLCLSLSPDSQFVVSGSSDKSLKVWSLQGSLGETATLIGHTDRVTAVAISPNGKFCISGSADATLKLWSVGEWLLIVSLAGHTGPVTSVAITADSKKCVSASVDLTLRVWSIDPELENVTITDGVKNVVHIAINPMGKMCVSRLSNRVCSVWDIETRRDVARGIRHSDPDSILCVAVSPDGQFIVSMGTNFLKKWSVQAQCEVTAIETDKSNVSCIGISPDCDLCVSGTSTGLLAVWSFSLKTKVGSLSKHASTVLSAAISSDSRLCVSGSTDLTVKLWNMATHTELKTLLGHTDLVSSVSFLPNRDWCVSASRDSTVRVWTLNTNAPTSEVMVFTGHSKAVLAIAVSQDGEYIASASEDCGVKIWSLYEGREIVTLRGLGRGVRFVAVANDMRYCLFGAEDSGFRMVDLAQICTYPIASGDCEPAHAHSFFQENIPKWTAGAATSHYAEMLSIWPQRVNCLHISAYYNFDLRVRDSLNAGVPIIRGIFGSPLTVAIQRQTTKCLDVFLRHCAHVVKTRKSDESWLVFYAITSDMPDILASNASALYTFVKMLMSKPAMPLLPTFILPAGELPVTNYSLSRYIDSHSFDLSDKDNPANELVDFYIGFIRWNFSLGSLSSIMLLKALGKCNNRKVLKSYFVATLLEDKWKKSLPAIWGFTVAYGLLLIDLVCIIFRYWRVDVLCSWFYALNALFLLVEMLQLIVLKSEYFKDPWNFIDNCRGIICIIWTTFVLAELDYEYLTLVVVILCFLRGFTYFRTIRMTRVFVFLTLEVIKEVYSFLLILAFSVFSFGLMASVLADDPQVTLSWTMAFNLLMGNSDSTNFRAVEWIVFMCACVINVIIMLNLLISILGDAYGNAQLGMIENDFLQMLEVILDFETILFWRRYAGEGRILVSCKSSKKDAEVKDWSGKVMDISRALKKDNRVIIEKLGNMEMKVEKLAGLEAKMEKLAGLEAKLEKIASIEAKLGSLSAVVEQLTNLQGKVGELSEKVRENNELLKRSVAKADM